MSQPIAFYAGLLCAAFAVYSVSVLLWRLLRRCSGANRSTRCATDLAPPLSLTAPWTLFVASMCHYDLSQTRTDERCPECGRCSNKRTDASTPLRFRAWRTLTLSVTVMVVALVHAAPADGRWVRWMPSSALVVTKRALPSSRTLTVDRVLDERLPDLAVWQRDMLLESYVEALRDDGVRWTALDALARLRNVGPAADPALHRALSSDDWQQRQLAASLLQRATVAPTDDLIRVSMEGLKSDYLSENLERSRRYLLQHAAFVDDVVIRTGMESLDLQLRFHSAELAAYGGHIGVRSTAIDLLVEHLADNSMSDDAVRATRALVHIGDPARDALRTASQSKDEQQRKTARLILLRLDGPPQSPSEEAERHRLNVITPVVLDPTSR